MLILHNLQFKKQPCSHLMAFFVLHCVVRTSVPQHANRALNRPTIHRLRAQTSEKVLLWSMTDVKTFLVEKPVVDTSLDIDCVYELSPCSVTCGGVGRRSVTIITKPRGRGSSCPSETEEQCYTPPCPSPDDYNFIWSPWSCCVGGVKKREDTRNISIQPVWPVF